MPPQLAVLERPVATRLCWFISRILRKDRRSEGRPTKIRNFGQVDEKLYRGGRPRNKDYAALAGLGVKTIVDLRERCDLKEKALTESHGMRYINIPMSDTRYPSLTAVEKFFDLINRPDTGKLFLHCAGGRHRTGVIAAAYRLTFNGWSHDCVYAEMLSYHFYTRWGHRPLKTFVQDYARTRSAKPKTGVATEL